MNQSKYIWFLLVGFLLTFGCDKKKMEEVRIPALNSKITSQGKAFFNDLTIYPITGSANSNDSIIHIRELDELSGVNYKYSLLGEDYFLRDGVYVANKTSKSSFIPVGQLFQLEKEELSIIESSAYIPSKTITQVNYFLFEANYNYSENDPNYFFPCPPVALKPFLKGDDRKTVNLITELMEQLGFPVSFGDETDEPREGMNMKKLDSLAFGDLFKGISQEENTVGCLVTYKGKVLMGRVYPNHHFFQKEWDDLILSIYYNQILGYTASELSELNDFVGVSAENQRMQTLWTQKTPEKGSLYRRTFIKDRALFFLWF